MFEKLKLVIKVKNCHQRRQIKKTFRVAMSLVEMLIALGVVGSAIFGMLMIAAKIRKVAVVNQWRNIATQTASQGIEMLIKAHKDNILFDEDSRNSLCEENDEIYIGLIEDNEGNLKVIREDLVSKPIDGSPLLLPMKAGQNGRWVKCSNDEAELFRGVGLKKVVDNNSTYIKVKVIVYWEIFGKTEWTIIDTRLPNVCQT